MAQTKVTRYFSTRKSATVPEIKSQKRKLDVYLTPEQQSLAENTKYKKTRAYGTKTLKNEKKRSKTPQLPLLNRVLDKTASKDGRPTPKLFHGIEQTNPTEPFKDNIRAGIAVETSMKKENIDVATLKQRLSKCKKIEDLKSHLASLNGDLAKIQQIRKEKLTSSEVKQQDSRDVVLPGCSKVSDVPPITLTITPTKHKPGTRSPSITPTKPPFLSISKEKLKVTSPRKLQNSKCDPEPAERLPAYQRHAHLVIPGTPKLSLPYKYRRLLETFSNLDTVVSMLHNRNEICTFLKLKAAVQRMSNKNFDEHQLGQIKTVYPSGYIYRQERNVPGEKSGYHLTVDANLSDESENHPVSDAHFSLTHITKRKNIFHNTLIMETKRAHKAYLAGLSPPVSIPDDKLHRWHPKFALDEVPDIVPSPLPQPPIVKQFKTAKDVLQHTRTKLLPRIERALTNVAAESLKDKTLTPQGTPKSEPLHIHRDKLNTDKISSTPCLDRVLKGVPSSLLEKIRAKEAASVTKHLQRNTAEEKRLSDLKRLPAMMKQLRNIFITEKKPALPKSMIVKKLADGLATAPGDIEQQLKVCLEVAPDWLSLVTISKGQYLKMDKTVEVGKLDDVINTLLKKAK